MPPGRLAAQRVAYEISMRTEREHRQKQKAAIRSQETFDKTWLGEVTRLTKNEPSTLSIQELKALLTVLVAYLAMAPNEESQAFIQKRINHIRSHLSRAAETPLFVVRPP